MTYRITEKMLEAGIVRINEALNVSNDCYKLTRTGKVRRDKSGHALVNVGTCYLSCAYGGYRVEQMCSGGGSRDLLSTGYETKRHVYDMISAFMTGIECGRKLKRSRR